MEQDGVPASSSGGNTSESVDDKSSGASFPSKQEELNQLRNRPIHDGTKDLGKLVSVSGHEIDSLFPTLPNPRLVYWKFPHLAGDSQVGIPMYATVFHMYEKPIYALPGEVMPK